jgi:lambda family phage minor tail protein L
MADSPLATEGLVVLYQLDTIRLGGPIFYFASATDFDRQIFWGGQQYSPLPMEATGFEYTTRGALPQPTVTISNIYGAGNLLLDSYRGLVGATVTRILTLARFLDDGETPDGSAFIQRDVFVVAQKTSHTAVAIAFKLASRMDQEGTMLPRRQMLRDVCSHTYRFFDTDHFDYSLASCPYTGPGYFNTADQPTTPDLDICSRSQAGCTARFGSLPLPARFFPGVGRVK